ncbi:hypothetical protein F946_00757 [Acinetobacter johnsonii ANC 3681]|uniref:GIY-YIG domain-containing protein n=1 Tax=Acinetobacter johnsonii ANC 3681 TaxID=1217662 RepID=N9CZI5_ACIJO|nr:MULTISPECIES: hypothetical protein [Acinetobacter]ENV73820.1 hypothetical protein F946_00757 [Acinetobacter johnsonii ANC 3681]VXA84740.1 conserved hypothetical protein [Acinetobacter sp. 8I-beige]
MIDYSYLDTLINDCEIAKQSKPINTYIYSSNEDLETFFILHRKELIQEDIFAIYIIKEINGNSEETRFKFEQFKHNKEIACPKLNHNPSDVLYVGSSSKNVINRLKQHILGAHSKTYALRLVNWFQGEYEIEIRTYKVASNILQLIEDNLSHNLHPAFGKTGGNNK